MGSISVRRETSRKRERCDRASRPAAPRLMLLICGPALCEVRFWTEAQWATLPEGERPRERAHAPGRGWFGVVPVAGMNKARRRRPQETPLTVYS
jgi:hypothetical protein